MEAGAGDPVRIELPKGTYVPSFSHNEKREMDTSGYAATPTSPAPRIAVLPFASLDEDPDVAHFSRGISAELTAALTALPGLEVIGWHSAQHYADEPFPEKEMKRDLGVGFVLVGSVRKSEKTIKVVSELVETKTESVLWAESRERDLSTAGLFEIMDQLTTRIVSSIGDYHGVIARHLVKETHHKRPHDLTAYEASLLFHHYLANYSHELYMRTRAAIERALEIDPGYALGWAQLAELHCDAYASWHDPSGWPDNALSCASRALALDPLGQEALTVSAYSHYLNREHENAIHDAEASVRLNPKAAFQVAWAGWLIGLSGQLDRGRQLIDDMESLNPYQPGWLRAVAYIYHLEKCEYLECLHEAQRIGMPEHPIDALMRAAAAGHAGNESVAVTAYRELNDKFPGVATNPAETMGMFFHFDHWIEAMIKGLDKAHAAARIA